MGCNCGGTKKVELNYVFTPPTGASKTYKSEIEARAAQIRQGGGTYVAVKR